MSQKTNPTSLRLLQNETSFHSSWFSDFFYGEITLHENETRLYIEKVCKETNYSCPLISLQSFYRKSPVFLFLHDIRATRREKEFSLRVPRTSLPPYATHFCEKQSNEKRRSVVLQGALQRQRVSAIPLLKTRRKTFEPMVKNCVSEAFLERTAPFVLRQLTSQKISKGTKQPFVSTFVDKLSVPPLHPSLRPFLILSTFWGAKQTQNNELFFVERALNLDRQYNAKPCFAHSFDMLAINSPRTRVFNKSHTDNGSRELHLSVAKLCRAPQEERLVHSNAPAALYRTKGAVSPYKAMLCKQDVGSSTLHAATAFTFLEPIRVVSDVQNAWVLLDQIINLLQKRAAFRQIKQKIFHELSKNTQIKGVRLSCRGRFGGRSKKAQKSKMQKDYWGETSLHAFSSRVSFVSKNASTPFGKIGIKLWLSFV